MYDLVVAGKIGAVSDSHGYASHGCDTEHDLLISKTSHYSFNIVSVDIDLDHLDKLICRAKHRPNEDLFDKIQEKIDTEIRDSTASRLLEQISEINHDSSKEDIKMLKK